MLSGKILGPDPLPLHASLTLRDAVLNIISVNVTQAWRQKNYLERRIHPQPDRKMKKLLISITACVLLVPGLAAANTFNGEIVNMGGKYMLFDGSSKAVYQLDDQSKTKSFAGQKVQVTGNLDKGTKAIHVTDIKAAP
jgi:hypothetical protein